MSITYKILSNWWVVFGAVFIIVRILIGQQYDLTARCGDGWRSSSIGIQGACSHHQGVDRSRAQNAFFISLLAAVIAAFGPTWWQSYQLSLKDNKKRCEMEKLKAEKREKEQQKYQQQQDEHKANPEIINERLKKIRLENVKLMELARIRNEEHKKRMRKGG